MNYMITLKDGTTLYHHGIKNQKWGVRRYQYEDGTLTPEGRKRYLKGEVYRNKELAKAEGYYNKKIDKSLKKMVKTGDDAPLEHWINTKQKEMEAIKKMTTDELFDEKHETIIRRGAQFAGPVLAGLSAATVGIGVVPRVPLESEREWKSNRRGVDPTYVPPTKEESLERARHKEGVQIAGDYYRSLGYDVIQNTNSRLTKREQKLLDEERKKSNQGSDVSEEEAAEFWKDLARQQLEKERKKRK